MNLQAPLTLNGSRFDTMDWALDIVIDGAWHWKDEHHLTEAIELGIFDEETAAQVRAEGERVIATRPWPPGWEDWRPPSQWTPLPRAARSPTASTSAPRPTRRACADSGWR